MTVIGTDIGGTFTDSVLIPEHGDVVTAKAPTRSSAPEKGVIESLQNLATQHGRDLSEILSDTTRFLHATTLATNVIVERSGSTVGLLTTKGHEDALKIGRLMTRHAGLSPNELKDYTGQDKAGLLVNPEHTLGVEERIDRDGEEVVALSEAEAYKKASTLVDRGIDSLAINFLWSFRDSSHEETARSVVEQNFDIPVYISSEVAPKMGEYERGETTVAAALVSTELSTYVKSLEADLREKGLSGPLFFMQSNGGLVDSQDVVDNGVAMVMSGPAAGITGAAQGNFQAAKTTTTEKRNIICTDVGGTSFDVGIVVNGEPMTTSNLTIDKHTIFQQSVDIRSIGNGGGSIVWLGSEDDLHIGPQSAGADPGPVCYGRGNDQPTITDADLVLGYLDPEYFLGGDLNLDIQSATDAIKEKIADPLGLDVKAAARGIYDLMNVQMADLLRKMTIERGHDPRNFSVFAYGGAGPVHAVGYARELNIGSVVVPLGNIASVFSAYGLTIADVRQVEEVSDPIAPPIDAEYLTERLRELKRAVDGQIDTRGGATVEYRVSVDMRYEGQQNELTVSLPPTVLKRGVRDIDLSDEFEKSYIERYGEKARFHTADVEIVTQRVVGELRLEERELERMQRSSRDPTPTKHREVAWGTRARQTPIYAGEDLANGHTIAGPAVVQLPATTVPIPHEGILRVGTHGSLTVHLGGESDD